MNAKAIANQLPREKVRIIAHVENMDKVNKIPVLNLKRSSFNNKAITKDKTTTRYPPKAL
jgi:hypothetical protein